MPHPDFPLTTDRATPALALSGGGFRATLFHCGGLMRLNELGLLSQLGRVASVSGGSIAAAKLAVEWNRMTRQGNRFSDLDSRVIRPLRKFCSQTIDLPAGIIGTLNPFSNPGVRLARAYEGYPARLLAFARKVYDSDVLHLAAVDFGFQDGFDLDDVDLPLFMPWFMHHWCPEASAGDCPPEFDAMPPAHVYFDRNRSREQPLLESYAWECMRAPFAFHEVCRVEPGQGMLLREYFSGEESFVHERTASAMLQPGQYIFALCVPVAEGRRIEAIGAYATEVGPPAGLSALRADIAATRSENRSSSTASFRPSTTCSQPPGSTLLRKPPKPWRLLIRARRQHDGTRTIRDRRPPHLDHLRTGKCRAGRLEAPSRRTGTVPNGPR